MIAPFIPFTLILVFSVIFFIFLYKSPERVFLCLILYFAFKSSTLFNINLAVNVMGFNIFLEDLISIFLAVELFLSLFNRNLSENIITSKYRILGKTYLLMSIIGVITWAYSEGIQTSVVNWRENLFSSLLILYCFSLNNWISYEVFSSVLYRGSLFLSLLILIRVLVHGIGNFSQVSSVNGVTDRATNASGALFLLLALWNFLLQMKTINLVNLLYICVLVTEILILQHRSVWLASIVGICYSGLKLNSVKLRIRMALLVSFLTPIIWYLLRSLSNLSAASTDSGTLTWRILRWQQSLGQSRSEVQILFGEVTGYIDRISVAGLTVAAHNMYISLFEKFGILGVIVYLVILIPDKVKFKDFDKLKNLDLVCSISLFFFGLFYSFPYIAVLILFTIRRIRSEFKWKLNNARF